jgi:hypothetical protein
MVDSSSAGSRPCSSGAQLSFSSRKTGASRGRMCTVLWTWVPCIRVAISRADTNSRVLYSRNWQPGRKQGTKRRRGPKPSGRTKSRQIELLRTPEIGTAEIICSTFTCLPLVYIKSENSHHPLPRPPKHLKEHLDPSQARIYIRIQRRHQSRAIPQQLPHRAD